MGKHQGPVITAQEVPSPPAQRQEGEVLLVCPALSKTQAVEEEGQEALIFDASAKFRHFGVVKEQLSLVVDVIEVFTDVTFGALALSIL